MTALTEADLARLEADANAATEHHGIVWTAARMYAPAAEVLALIAIARRARRMEEALRPFAKAAEVFRNAMTNFHVDGETWTERAFSEGERRDTAWEMAGEYLASLPSEAWLEADAATTDDDAILSEPGASHGGELQ